MSNLTSIREVPAQARYSLVSGKRIPADKARKGVPTWLLEHIKAEQEARFAPNPYKSVSECFAAFRQVMPKGHWRLCNYLLGHINGLPNLTGRSIATNGILVLVINRCNMTCFFGHLENFVLDDEVEVEKPTKEPKECSFDKSLMDFGK